MQWMEICLCIHLRWMVTVPFAWTRSVRKGPTQSLLQLIGQWEMIVNMDLLSNFTFMTCALLILAQQAGICLQLLVGGDSHNVCENWEIDIHITPKHQCSRSHALQNNVRNTMHNTQSNGTCIIQCSFQISLCCDHGTMEHSAEDLTDVAMGVWEEILPLQITQSTSMNSQLLPLNSGPLSATTLSGLGHHDSQVFLKVHTFLALLVEVTHEISRRLVTGSTIVLAQNSAEML